MTMLFWSGCWLGACALIALAWPVLEWRRAAPGSAARRQAGRYCLGSALVVLVAACYAGGVSLAWHAANVWMVLLAGVCAGAVALQAFRIPQRWLRIPVGCSCVAGWLLLALMLAPQNEDDPALTVQLDNGLHCSSTSHMVFLSDSVRELRLYRHFVLVDYQLGRWGYQGSAVLGRPDPPAPWQAAFEQCETRTDDVLALRREQP